MKLRFVVLTAAAVLAVTSLPAAVLLPRQGAQGRTISSASVSSAAAKAAYVLGVYQGKVAVYSPGGGAPQEVLNIYVTTLPQEEQQKLRQGIQVKNRQQLLSIEESFST